MPQIGQVRRCGGTVPEATTSLKNYAARLEIRCPGGVYFNRDNSQLAPIIADVMPSKCELAHGRARNGARLWTGLLHVIPELGHTAGRRPQDVSDQEIDPS
jgi:hypothetical protein